MELILPRLIEERKNAGCPSLPKLNPQRVFEEFQKFIFNKTENLDAEDFEKAYLTIEFKQHMRKLNHLDFP